VPYDGDMSISGNKQFVVRARAIIVYNDRLLVVRHAHNPSYAALPGGHLEFGESPHVALVREIEEELGVTPILGRLLYVNTFTIDVDGGSTQPVEFFFVVENPADFLSLREQHDRSHAHELAAVEWIAQNDKEVVLRPRALLQDFVDGKLFSDGVRFIES
jgi:8-oxo-dGTP pyrophosphatase MutT (NUDIX family)